jgi:ubiquinone/menaquinone biosynthesis C-methylase UbiE
LITTIKNYIKRHVFASPVQEKGAMEAYDIWAGNYDAQPGNLMLDLDELVFGRLLNNIDIKNKAVADIGCGTGRHWAKILKKEPASLSGFDVSPGMLKKLGEKFPTASTHVIIDNLFSEVDDQTFDVILSTLTVAHIENIEEALEVWCRITKEKGEIIITDFHPDALAFGGKRTFKHQNKHIAVQNFVHHIDTIKAILLKHNFHVVAEEEMRVDEKVKHYYQQQNALHVYERFKHFPIIYGIHFRRVS